MSDTGAKAEDEVSHNREDVRDDGGDDEVRDGPFPIRRFTQWPKRHEKTARL